MSYTCHSGLDTPFARLSGFWGVSQADSTYLAYGKGGPKMFRAVCMAEACFRLSPLPEDLGRAVWSQGTKSPGSRRLGWHVLWQAEGPKVEQNRPEVPKFGLGVN